MTRAVLGLGSNLGDRLGYLRSAVSGLSDSVVAVSHVYETDAWGPVPQGLFLNAVVIVENAEFTPHDWLKRARALEALAGRVRRVRWGPRTLDVDLITVDDVQLDDPQLTLPHPGAHCRATVLVPWLDADPSAELVGHGRVADLVHNIDDSGVRMRAEWDLRQ